MACGTGSAATGDSRSWRGAGAWVVVVDTSQSDTAVMRCLGVTLATCPNIAVALSLPNMAPLLPSLQVLLGTALGGICYRGGIIQDNEDRPEVVKEAGSQQGGSTAAAPAGSAV